MDIDVVINGQPVVAAVEPQELLLDFLRDRLKLSGTKRSCEVQVCGTCTVLVDGEPVSACSYLAFEVDQRAVLTIEGMAELPEFADYEAAFDRHAALQCGFCTPGFLLTLKALKDAGQLGTEEALRHGLEGNICRCTGYRAILQAAREVAGLAPLAETRA